MVCVGQTHVGVLCQSRNAFAIRQLAKSVFTFPVTNIDWNADYGPASSWVYILTFAVPSHTSLAGVDFETNKDVSERGLAPSFDNTCIEMCSIIYFNQKRTKQKKKKIQTSSRKYQLASSCYKKPHKLCWPANKYHKVTMNKGGVRC